MIIYIYIYACFIQARVRSPGQRIKDSVVDTIPFRAFRLKVLRLTIQVLRLPVFFFKRKKKKNCFKQ